MFARWLYPILMLLLLILPIRVEAQSVAVIPQITGSEQIRESIKPLFPTLLFTESYNTYKAQEAGRPYWVASETEIAAWARVQKENTSILLNNDILAFYGHPLSRNMGILGRYPITELDTRLTNLANEYKAVSGGRDVRKAFYIIFGTVWPEGEIGIIRESVLMEYIQYGLDHDILVFIDHQIGRYDPIASLKRLLPYLRYPNVHLALDPEWRTTRPMKEIGSVTAAEINTAQQVMEEYMIENNIPGERMLVIHQFKPWMIQDRENVRTGRDKVRLIHCADGFGNPGQKRDSYAANALARNIPLKSFKLFYNFEIPGAGYDAPLLSPSQVYGLNPRPYLIMYQ
ncbi:hypothetical protein [Treponema primitia]|uniref:hypothetical protein n=1 Tax=Treponema primitia TaxID=88058 RepID=UPI00047539EE|nr:hypothetical protein [Treponema primitia]